MEKGIGKPSVGAAAYPKGTGSTIRSFFAVYRWRCPPQQVNNTRQPRLHGTRSQHPPRLPPGGEGVGAADG